MVCVYLDVYGMTRCVCMYAIRLHMRVRMHPHARMSDDVSVYEYTRENPWRARIVVRLLASSVAVCVVRR